MPAETQPPLTRQQKINLIGNLSLFPAITVMVFLRRRLGYRYLKPWRLLIMALVILIVTKIADGFNTIVSFGMTDVQPSHYTLTFFVIVMLLYGLYARHQRWKEIRAEVDWHTYSPGISILKPFVPFRDDVLFRFVEPAVCFGTGLIISVFFHPLGAWLMFSAVMLYIFEQVMYEQRLEAYLDSRDSLCEARMRSQEVRPQSTQVSIRNAEITPAGNGSDIDRLLQTANRSSLKI